MSKSYLSNIKTKYIGRYIDYYSCIDSTNIQMKRVGKNMPEGYTIVAEKQENGKGRLGRVWQSQSCDSIYMSILLKPDIHIAQVPIITLLCGLSVCKTIERVTGEEFGIKWPNDIVHRNKKLAGILCEGCMTGDKPEFVVVGLGLNVSNRIFPDEISSKACSLYTIQGKDYDKKGIICDILSDFEQHYEMFKKDAYFFLDEYKKKCVTLGREVSFKKNSLDFSGVAYDIDCNGDLLVKTDSGSVTVSSGEVTVQGIY